MNNPLSASKSSLNWLVLYVKGRAELKTASRLEALGVRIYVPIITTVKQWSDRKKKVTHPAISGIIFVQISANEKNIVFSLPGVLRYLKIDGAIAQVKDQEIRDMHHYLMGGYKISQDKIIIGQRIYLEAFKVYGTINKISARHFWVNVPKSDITLCLRAA
jgi:transcriptional antiterminator RfaH